MLEREHITLAITLQVNIKTDTWIGTHNIGYSYANKYKKTLQLAHIILVIATHKNTTRSTRPIDAKRWALKEVMSLKNV